MVIKTYSETPLIIKPIIDDRYSKDKISTHNKQEYDCISVNSLIEIKDKSQIIIRQLKKHNSLRSIIVVIDQVEIKGKKL